MRLSCRMGGGGLGGAQRHPPPSIGATQWHHLQGRGARGLPPPSRGAWAGNNERFQSPWKELQWKSKNALHPPGPREERRRA